MSIHTPGNQTNQMINPSYELGVKTWVMKMHVLCSFICGLTLKPLLKVTINPPPRNTYDWHLLEEMWLSTAIYLANFTNLIIVRKVEPGIDMLYCGLLADFFAPS